MNKILVTGGSGFIGTNLLERVAALNFDLQEGRDILDLIDPFESPDTIVHLAARTNTREAVENPYSYLETNLVGSLNILQYALLHGVKNLVLASSSSANDPLSPYGVSKLAMEALAKTYHHNFGLNITCLRFFNVYGPHNRKDMLPYIWTKALLNDEEIEISGDGSRTRDFTYVGDIVDGIIKAVEKPLGFEVIDLGNGKPISLNEFLATLERVVSKKAKVKYRPSHHASVENTCADTTKATELLEWKATTTLEEGIIKLVTDCQTYASSYNPLDI